MDPLIGRTLGGVRIDRMIGQGGMARVYYGWDERLQRPVAIKVIGEAYRSDPAFVERFLREARTVASLQHPNILQIYNSGEEDGYSYFLMEYVRGLNLEQLLHQQNGRLLPYNDVLRIGRAVASALDYAHAKGVVHRDVKPSNIILAEDGRVVLADFGLAMQTTTNTMGQVFGSPHYIAPEQAQNSALAVAQSDQYALGIVMYEMLTGHVPFHDDSPAALALQHITQAPPIPSQVNPNLPDGVDGVLLRALSKRPQDRFVSSQELLNALEPTLTGSPHQTVAPAQTMRVLPYTAQPRARQAARSAMPTPSTFPPQGSTRPGEGYSAQAASPGAAQSATRGGVLPAHTGRNVGCVAGIVLALILIMIAATYGVSLLRGASGFFAFGGNPQQTQTAEAALRAAVNAPATQTALAAHFTPTPTSTSVPTLTVTGTASPVPPTDTPLPTATPTATPIPPTATPVIAYDIVLVKSGNSSLFVVNNSAVNFPLADLQLGDKPNALPGSAWGVDVLKPKDCAVITNADKESKLKLPKDLKCNLINPMLRVNPDQSFWNATFQFFYKGTFLDICQQNDPVCEFKFNALP